jgi:D-arabinose 1-dehydrogenase-like Zn-dependent alcohol dehydrogenase
MRGGGFAGVIDFVGSGATFQQSVNLVNRGGKLIVVGLLGGSAKISIPILPLKGIQIIGNYLGSLEEFKVCLISPTLSFSFLIFIYCPDFEINPNNK